MKKLGVALTVALLGLAPLLAHAGTFVGRDSYSTTTQERVAGNLYVAGGTVMSGAAVDGDLAVLGGNLTTTGRVGDDLFAAGGNIQVLSPVNGDVRILGGQVSLNDRVGGELLVLAGTVNILSNSIIQGDVTVIGGQVVIDGIVQGSVRYFGGRLTVNGVVQGDVNAKASEKLIIGSTARIGGNLDYKSPSEADVNDGARIVGKVSYEPMTELKINKQAPRMALAAIVGIFTGLKTLAYLGMVLLIVWLWRRPAMDVIQEAHDRFWHSLGRGLVYMILTPIAAVLLMVSFVGFIPGILLLMAYGALMIVAKIMAGIFLGAWIWAVVKKKGALQVTWLNAIVGMILLEFVGVIPVLGWIAKLIILLAIFGVGASRVQKAIV